jgi:hypothetical protein
MGLLSATRDAFVRIIEPVKDVVAGWTRTVE